MRVSPLQSYCMCERAKRHVWLVSLYIGLQAVFIIFHYSCFMHDCARRAVIGSVGVEANQGRLNSGAQHSVQKKKKNTPQMSWPFHKTKYFPGRIETKNILCKCNQKRHMKPTAGIYFWICRNLQCQQGLNPVHVWNFCFFCLIWTPSETSCYYGKGAARLTSKSTAFIFIFPGYAENLGSDSLSADLEHLKLTEVFACVSQTVMKYFAALSEISWKHAILRHEILLTYSALTPLKHNKHQKVHELFIICGVFC